MPKVITVTEAVRHFSEIIGRVRFYGERVILTKGGKPVAEIRPADTAARIRLGDLFRILAESPQLTPKELDAFAQDLEAVRKEVGRIPEAGPWESS